MEWSVCSLALRYSLERWPRYPLARSSTTLRFLWALTARFTRAMCSTPSRRTGSLAQQLLHVLRVGRRERHVVRQAASLGARLVLKVMGSVRPAAHDLARPGNAESLLRAAVGLHFRHVAASLVPRLPAARVLASPISRHPRSFARLAARVLALPA